MYIERQFRIVFLREKDEPPLNLTSVDWLIMLLYFVFVLGIGFALKRFMKTSKDYLQAGRSLPAWICGLAFISANLGAQEVIGMGASGAKYGIVTSHFYWIGAIPAMIFVSFVMLPVYTRYLRPSQYGAIELIEMSFDLLTMVAGARLHGGVFRYYYKAETETERNAVISTGA